MYEVYKRNRKRDAKTHDDCVEHFQKRCMERLGYILHQKFLKEELAAGRLRRHSVQSDNRIRYILRRKFGRDLVVVYDKRRNAFVTVMFLDLMEPRNGKRWNVQHGSGNCRS